MFLYTQQVNQLLSVLTITSHLVIILFLSLLSIKFLAKKKISFVEKIFRILKKQALLFVFIIASVATAGSLFFSEIAGYTPCDLCWYQRIFMYPLVLIFGIALWKKDLNIKRYVTPMALIGLHIGVIQYIGTLTKKAEQTMTCSLTGPSCFVDYFKEYGYITITMMAITAFTMIFILTRYMGKEK